MAQRGTFPFYRFSGTHREIGRQYGEACRELIREHRDLALERLEGKAGVPPQKVLEAALTYRPFVQRYAGFFDEEIQGLAEGAGLTLAEAYLLQLRAELTESFAPRAAEVSECTTFAVQPEAALGGTPLLGQNADLPAFYTELGVVLELVPDDAPAVLMLTPAGQVSYIGINDQGLGVCANYLTCGGWRRGFPRYLWSRLALTERTVEKAIRAVESVYRASSRNLILADASGGAADLETTPTRTARLEPKDGLLAHANHYLSQELGSEERSPALELANSRTRQARLEALLREHHGTLDVSTIQRLLRDREGCPDALCRGLGDDEGDIITFAALIAEPAEGRIWVAKGPPHEHPFESHSFSAQGDAPQQVGAARGEA